MTTLIRTLSPTDDFAALTAMIHRAYARLGAMGLNYTAVDQSVETTRRRCATGTCFLAVCGDDYLGTISVTGPDPTHDCTHYKLLAHAHQFEVDRAAQGSGVGKALMQAAEQWARAQGHDAIAVDTAEQAEHLIRLYQRWGYIAVGHMQWSGKVYRSVVMRKTL
jgi:GNAT superfamily N-acetyltransferase